MKLILLSLQKWINLFYIYTYLNFSWFYLYISGAEYSNERSSDSEVIFSHLNVKITVK